MIDGIANGPEQQFPLHKRPEVLVLAQIKPIHADNPTVFSANVAETGSVLLHVSKTVAFVCGGSDDTRLVCCQGLSAVDPLVEIAREIARVANAISEPVFLQDLSNGDSELACRLASSGVESLACVPESQDNSITGIYIAMSEEARAFTSSDIEVLRILAAEAIREADVASTEAELHSRSHEHDVLIELAHRKIRELSVLNRVSKAVSSTLDLNKLLELALEHGMAAVGADAGSLMLINRDNNKLEIAASNGLPGKLVAETSLPIGLSIAGYVAKNGISVLVSDARLDERFSMPAYRDEITSSASVPLCYRESIIGVLNVNTVQANHYFDERDLQLLETIANHMAVAIENARLHARVIRRTAQLDSLLKITKTLTSTLNLNEVLHRLSDELCSLFSMDVCVILLVDSLRGKFRFGHATGLRFRNKHGYFDLALPIATRIRATGRRIMHSDIGKHRTLKTAISNQENLHGMVGLPLRHGGKLVAVATAFSHKKSTFPQSLRDIAKSLPNLAGTAVYNAGIFGNKYRIAGLVQSRLVPTSLQVCDKVEVGTRFVSCREVGGDYCDFIRHSPEVFSVVLGDVSGSDVEAAEYTLMGKHAIRAYSRDCDSPAEVLGRANNHIYEDSGTEFFISLFYASFDMCKMQISYANGGSEPALLYRKSTRECFRLKSDGMVLGIMPDTVYQEQRMSIAPGDIVVVVTDGVTEAGTNKQRFEMDGVEKAIRECEGMCSQDVADKLYKQVVDWVGGPSHDDIGIIVVKIL